MPAVNHAAIAAETGYPIHEVLSRGATFCRRNPRTPGGDPEFDQSLPADFDTVVVETNSAEAEEVRQANAPTGLVDRDLDVEARIALYNAEDVSRRARDAASEANATRTAALVPIYLRGEPVDGGTAFVGRVGERDMFTTIALSDEDALVFEPLCRDFLHSLALHAQPTAA